MMVSKGGATSWPHDEPLARPLWRATLCAAVLFSAALDPQLALAQHKDTFPTAHEVGGQVFRDGLKPGDAFPTDIEAYDDNGTRVDLGALVKGKRTWLVFFSSATPASVDELTRIEEFVVSGAPGTQLLFLHADTVGVELTGGPMRAVPETARTLRVIKQERKLRSPLLVAAFSPDGISNRLGLRALPTSYVVNADDKVEQIFVGPQPWSGQHGRIQATSGAPKTSAPPQGGMMQGGCPMMRRGAEMGATMQHMQQQMTRMMSMMHQMEERMTRAGAGLSR